MRSPRLLMLALTSTLALLAAACGTDAAPPPAEPAPDQAQDQAAAPISATFWYAGFKVTLDGATVDIPEGGSGEMVLAGSFENIGPAEQGFPTQDLYIEREGRVIQAGYSDLAMVPAGATTRGGISFMVEEGFRVDDALLYAGAPAVHQAVVPLGTVGLLHDCAPEPVTLAEEFMAGTVRVTITGGELRAWSFPFASSGEQTEAGTLVLALTADFAYEGDWENTAVFSDQVKLELPDGTTVQPVGMLGDAMMDRGEAVTGVVLEFRVPMEPEGEYTLTITEFDVSAGMGDVDDPEGSVAFAL